jgi:hypothetical protein
MSCDLKQELTGFDRRDHQDVYGRKNIANVLKHRTMLATAMTWSGVFDNGSNGYDLIPGPGSTYNVSPIPVALVTSHDGVFLRELTNAESFGGVVTVPTFWKPQFPVSTTYAPNGEALMAYVQDNTTSAGRKICWKRRNTSGVWGAENCSNSCAPTQNTVSTTRDPETGRFLMAHRCTQGPSTGVLLTIFASNCHFFSCRGSSAFITEIPDVAEAPAIACSDQPAPLYGNCRIVYAKRNVFGQPIEWRTFGLIGPPPYGVVLSNEQTTSITSEQRPAIAYFQGNFWMALTHFGRDVYVYNLATSAGSNWNQQAILNNAGWVSPPFISTSNCAGCTGKLHVFWLSYPVPPFLP